MRFWVELKDHVPNGQTETSLLRFNTKQTFSESMSGGKGVTAVTDLSELGECLGIPEKLHA